METIKYIETEPSNRRLHIHVGSRRYIPPEEIQHLESDLNYTLISLIDGKKILSSTTLKKIESRLVSFKNFVRVNKSLIESLDFVETKRSTVQFYQTKSFIPMKKNIWGGVMLFLAFLFAVGFTFGQNIILQPDRFNVNSTGGYGAFSTTSSNVSDLYFLREAGNVSAGTISTSNDRFFMLGGTTHDLVLGAGGNGGEQIRVTTGGLIGIGISNPHFKIHFHEPTAATALNFQLTNADAGSVASDGLKISLNPNSGFFPFGVVINNQENAGLYFNTNNNTRMAIDETGKVGIGTNYPSTRLHVWGGNSGVTPNPSSIFFTEKNSNNYLGIASPDTNESGILFGKPTLGAASGGIVYTATNDMDLRTGGNFTRMTITSTGNVNVNGFTALGNDASAPKIKMKTLTNTTAAAQGGSSNFAHGLTVSKVIDYVVMVEVSTDVWIKSNHVNFAGRQFDTEINGTNVRVYNSASNSSSILTKPIKVLITYTE